MNATATKAVSPTRKIMIQVITILLIVCILGAIGWGIYTYYQLDRVLYTNDAQVEQYISPVNTRITGYIREVRFTDHQRVKKGDTLVLIDDREFRIAVEQAEAAWLSARASRSVTASAVHTVNSTLGVTDANIRALEARIWNAEQNYRRFENLVKEDAATQQQFDQVKTEYTALLEQKDALVRQKQTTNLSSEETTRRVPVNDAEIKRAHAVMDLTALNLSYTVITAPYDGVTGRRTIQEGQAVTAGQTLLSFVRSESKWVVANFKETQVTHLHIGQKMSLTIDGIEEKRFEGRVSAISEATGSRYSAIPVDNSTGNFVKVRQRIPVRIEFAGLKDSHDLDRLIAGMNVEVRVAENQ
jgi:membrane fusion protein (multidrug efflux system)